MPMLVLQQLLLFVHLMGFAFAMAAVARADIELLRARSVDVAALRHTARGMKWLLLLLWASGLALVALDPRFSWATPLESAKMDAKLSVVLLLTLNGWALHRYAFPCFEDPPADPRNAARICALLGAVSTTSWLFAAFFGVSRLIAPVTSYAAYMALYGSALLIAAAFALTVVSRRVRQQLGWARESLISEAAPDVALQPAQ